MMVLLMAIFQYFICSCSAQNVISGHTKTSLSKMGAQPLDVNSKNDG